MFSELFGIPSTEDKPAEVTYIDAPSSSSKPNKFPKKELKKEPYLPISVFVERELPIEVKNQMYYIIDKLLNLQYTVRLNGDDVEFYDRIKSLSKEHLEVYIPWKKFNNIETKFYYNHDALKHIAQARFAGWDKIPDSVKSIVTRNFRMILGDKNDSCTNCVLLWTKDGATRPAEINKDTGRLSYIITFAHKHGIPVINLKKEQLLQAFLAAYGIT